MHRARGPWKSTRTPAGSFTRADSRTRAAQVSDEGVQACALVPGLVSELLRCGAEAHARVVRRMAERRRELEAGLAPSTGDRCRV